MDSESNRYFFLHQLKELLQLSSAELAEVDRLIKKIQRGGQLYRGEIIYLAGIKQQAENARISMPTSQNHPKFEHESASGDLFVCGGAYISRPDC